MEMVKKLEKFIDGQIKNAEKHQNSSQMVYHFRGIAYGALMFALESGVIEFQAGAALWDRKKPEFDKLM